MNQQHIDEPRFATVKAADIEYQIYLTSPDRDYIQKNLANKGVPYELPMLIDMSSRLSETSTVLDIGANIGNHTFYLSNVVQCHVIAFEANDVLAHAMNITASESGMEDKVIVHAFALGEKPGFAEFDQIIPDNLGGQSLRKGGGTIKVRTLDSFGIAGPVAAIKIDVEGMELDVLKGGKKIIEQNNPILYIEAQTKEHFLEISEYLAQFGYCYRDTFNATPTHLFIHRSKLKTDEKQDITSLRRVEHEYDLLEANKKLKQSLAECRIKYRDLCQVNSNLKSESAELRSVTESVASSSAQEATKSLRLELEHVQAQLTASECACDRLKKQLADERLEKEMQIQQFAQNSVNARADTAIQEKLNSEIERLTTENRGQKILLDAQQSMKFELDDCQKKLAEMAFILENANAEVARLQAENARLGMSDNADQLEALNEKLSMRQQEEHRIKSELEKQLEKNNRLLEANEQQALQLKELQIQVLELDNIKGKYNEQQFIIDNDKSEIAIAQTQLKELSIELDIARSEIAKLKIVEQSLADIRASLEQEKQNAIDAIAALKTDHENYIQGLHELYGQQQLDNEQQMQFLIKKKLESLAPLQANHEKIDRLVEYRTDIEKMYGERTPFLNSIQTSGNSIEYINEKKCALNALKEQLAAINSQWEPRK